MKNKRLSHFVTRVQRHPSLQDPGVVRRLMDAHAEISMHQAVQQTAKKIWYFRTRSYSCFKWWRFSC